MKETFVQWLQLNARSLSSSYGAKNKFQFLPIGNFDCHVFTEIRNDVTKVLSKYSPQSVFFLILVERFISRYGSPKNIWGRRRPHLAYVLWKTYGSWSRGRPFRWWMERIHSQSRWRQRQTRFPNETGRLNQQWVLKCDIQRHILYIWERFCDRIAGFSINADTLRKVNLLPV